MAADTDATLGVQPAFALALATRVLEEEFLSGWVAKAKNHVRNKLLEARILLHRRPRPVAGMGRVEQIRQIALGVATEALKMADSMKNLRRNDEDMFGGNQRHWEIPF